MRYFNLINQTENELILESKSLFNFHLKKRRKWGLVSLILGLLGVSILPYSPLYLEKNQIKCDRIEPTLIDCQVKKIKFFGLYQKSENLQRIKNSSVLSTYIPLGREAEVNYFWDHPKQSQLNLSGWNYDKNWLFLWKKNAEQFSFLVMTVFILLGIAHVLFSVNDLIIILNKKDKCLTFITKNCYKKNRDQYSLESVKEIGYQESCIINTAGVIGSSSSNLVLVTDEKNVIVNQLLVPFYAKEEVLYLLINFWENNMGEYNLKIIEILDQQGNKKYVFDQHNFSEYNLINLEKIREIPIVNILEIEPVYHTITITEQDEEGKNIETQREKLDLTLKYKSDSPNENSIISYCILEGIIKNQFVFFTISPELLIGQLQRFIKQKKNTEF